MQNGKVTTTNELAEWDYGKYEGLLTKEIRARRKERGLDNERSWDIWKDGCEDGEWEKGPRFLSSEVLIACRSPQQVTDRLDALIQKIYALQKDRMHGENPADVLLVSEPLRLRHIRISSYIYSNIRLHTAIFYEHLRRGGSNFRWNFLCRWWWSQEASAYWVTNIIALTNPPSSSAWDFPRSRRHWKAEPPSIKYWHRSQWGVHFWIEFARYLAIDICHHSSKHGPLIWSNICATERINSHCRLQSKMIFSLLINHVSILLLNITCSPCQMSRFLAKFKSSDLQTSKRTTFPDGSRNTVTIWVKPPGRSEVAIKRIPHQTTATRLPGGSGPFTRWSEHHFDQDIWGVVWRIMEE